MTTKDNKTTDDKGDLRNLMTFRFARIQARANAQAARILKSHTGISLSEWRMMVMVDVHGKITPAQIVRITNFDKALVSRTLKGMQQKGLLTIETSATDSRSHVIDFTPKGRDVHKRTKPIMQRRQETLAASLAPGELKVLFQSLDKIDAALDTFEEQS